MALQKIAGSKIYIGGPVAYNKFVSAGDFSGETWTEIKGWTQAGDLTTEQETLSQAVISDNVTEYAKGTISYPTMDNQFVPDPNDPGQVALLLAQQNCKPYAFRIEWGADCAAEAAVTISQASPGKVTWAAHGLENGTQIILSTTGTLPTGLVPGQVYYVTNKASGNFELAETPGGASINTTGAGTGTHRARALVPQDNDMFFGLALPGGKTGGGNSDLRLLNASIQRISNTYTA